LLWLLIAAAAAAAAANAADAPPLILDHLTTADGLPQSTVMATLQDSQGFMWFATEDGLARFDGHEFHRYAYSRNARGGLPGNFIRDIAAGAHHDLWIAIKEGGLARWNRLTDSFTVYRHDPANPASLASDAARAVLVDARGRVWIGTEDAGIDVLDPVSNRITHLRHDPRDPNSLSSDCIFSFLLDRSGTLWVATSGGLDRSRPDHDAFDHFRHRADDPHSLSSNDVLAVLEDKTGALWVGTSDAGLNRMDRSGRVLEVFRHDARDATSLASDDVRSLLEDRAGRLWVGTTNGLDLLDRSSGHFTHYQRDERDAGSLRDSFILSLYEDRAGLVWIGTRGGVSRWNPHSWELGAHRPDWLGDKLVTAFADAANGNVWIASMGGGLVQFNPQSGAAINIDTFLDRHNVLGDTRVMVLQLDRQDALWIGTMTSGLKRLSTDGRLESIAVKVGDPRSVSAAGFMTGFAARDGQIWLGTHGGGVNVLDPQSGLIRQLPYGTSPGAISSANVSAIAEDAQGNFWIGTDGGGLDLARADGSVIKVYRHDPSDPTTLPSNTVFAVALDRQGRIWVATAGGGLALVVGSIDAPDAIRFQSISREEGLSSDTIYGIVTDANGRLWLSGNAGLMRFDPDTHVVKTYHREHGLQGEEFDFNAFHRLRDGRLCFGGPGGFNIFDPSHLSENPQAPSVALTHIEVLGVPMPSATPYWRLDRIGLDYQASIVSLDFGVLDFISPQRNRLAYRVAGLSDRWIELGTQHRVTLTNLDAGNHLLEVRAANADSVWSDPLRLTIRKKPAPWHTPSAYAAYAIAVLLIVIYLLRRQRAKMQRIVREQQRLELEVALRTRELVHSNQQLAEASQAKSNFLARMSHELRTPMNGVVGMTELLARTTLSTAQAKLTQTIRTSAQILLQIVNDLLDLSKIQAGKVEFEALPVDLERVLEECTVLFSGAASAKGVELIVCPPEDCRTFIGDPLRIRQIVMNLVGNAVKFTLQGEIVVKADISAVESGRATVRITVVDTGVGIDAATIDKIFQPFTQADESTTRRFGGSGLGLAICRELAELMGGAIDVDSRPGVGSTFCVSLPLQLAADELQQNPVQLATRRVRILTRRPALAESLTRHVAALGFTVCTDDIGHSAAANGKDVVIADLTTYEAYVRSVLRAPRASRPPLVIVAAQGDIESLQLGQSIDVEAIVPKPVHRDVLRDALAVATGHTLAASNAVPAILEQTAIGGHVLVVEDEPVNAAVAQGYLAALGCTSAWVETGPQAIARSATETFDLIMMDLNMPTMDGFATTRLIREREGTQRRVPIVAFTAHDSASYREVCLSAGMDDLLSKPYTLDQCAEVLRRWIERTAEPSGRVITVQTAIAPSSVDAKAVATLRSMRVSGQVDLYSKLVDLFAASSKESMNQLGIAFGVGDFKAASTACHKLASSAANVGALDFAKDARQCERLCDSGDHSGAQHLYDRLNAAYPALIEELTRLQLRASA
jgi:signal transduction histidine kinase/ligand-binding sensor domain-containing protein/CheY-like chemotaxis protein/HPt (histidine-containing phosphotransfer) domain-containing protein